MPRRSFPTPQRQLRPVRPTCEVLEGRALLAASPLDLTFGAGGVVTGVVSTSGDVPSAAITALAVQSSGRIVTAEVATPVAGSTSTLVPLIIRGYSTNGAIDTTFGTGGQTIIPFNNTISDLRTAPANLLVETDGSILVATEAEGFVNDILQFEDVVVRLTSNGQLDPTFGTNGEVVLPTSVMHASSVAIESSGRILVGGIILGNTSANTTAQPVPVVVGLTSTGALDNGFGVGGLAAIPQPPLTALGSTNYQVQPTGLAVTPAGQILVSQIATNINQSSYAQVGISTLSRLTAAGAIDTTFGTTGSGVIDLSSRVQISGLAVQPDGRIVLGGTLKQDIGLNVNPVTSPSVIRLDAAGTIDPTFANTIPPTYPPNLVPASTPGYQSVAFDSNGRIVLTSGNTVTRLLSSGLRDSAFGLTGQVTLSIPGDNPLLIDQVVPTATGALLIGGQFTNATPLNLIGTIAQTALIRILPSHQSIAPNDFDGDGKSDLTVQLPQYGVFATHSSATGATTLRAFGPAGDPSAIPVPGSFDGGGLANPAIYLPTLGTQTYRLSNGNDVPNRFGPTGLGSAIPAPGDYDGDGRTDVALFLPGSATFIVAPYQKTPYAVQFGQAGVGNSIPAPGDYDGDGKTDLAVYLPTLGVLAYRPSSGSSGDVLIRFGQPGAGNSIPAPGDYDGDGKTDVAAFLPTFGILAVRPSGGGADVLTRFGPTGAGNAVPVPGDYDGDGKTDVALFLPGSATYAIDPSGGQAPYAVQFGAAGVGNSIPVTAVVNSSLSTVRSQSLAVNPSSAAASGVPVYLPDDLIGAVASTRKKTTA